MQAGLSLQFSSLLDSVLIFMKLRPVLMNCQMKKPKFKKLEYLLVIGLFKQAM